MNVFVAGATGAIGQRLVPLLAARGHDVVAMSRSGAGEHGVAVDALDRTAVIQAVMRAEPDVVVHELTGLRARPACATSTARSRSPTACAPRARTTCSRQRARPASAASSPRASATGTTSARGSPVKSEDDPLDPSPPPHAARVARGDPSRRGGDARRRRAEGVVLRYGNLYGPAPA